MTTKKLYRPYQPYVLSVSLIMDENHRSIKEWAIYYSGSIRPHYEILPENKVKVVSLSVFSNLEELTRRFAVVVMNTIDDYRGPKPRRKMNTGASIDGCSGRINMHIYNAVLFNQFKAYGKTIASKCEKLVGDEIRSMIEFSSTIEFPLPENVVD